MRRVILSVFCSTLLLGAIGCSDALNGSNTGTSSGELSSEACDQVQKCLSSCPGQDACIQKCAEVAGLDVAQAKVCTVETSSGELTKTGGPPCPKGPAYPSSQKPRACLTVITYCVHEPTGKLCQYGNSCVPKAARTSPAWSCGY
ncbi:MAG: hypothetical protein ABEL76_17480 [Bradymonadaceae bacterium]